MNGEREWYFFVPRWDTKTIGSGSGRRNRTTKSGFWKATGSERNINIMSSSSTIGMKKTLVFYRGRAPHGCKTSWVMNEYRLPQRPLALELGKEEVVLCKIYLKATSLTVLEKRSAAIIIQDSRILVADQEEASRALSVNFNQRQLIEAAAAMNMTTTSNNYTLPVKNYATSLKRAYDHHHHHQEEEEENKEVQQLPSNKKSRHTVHMHPIRKQPNLLLPQIEVPAKDTKIWSQLDQVEVEDRPFFWNSPLHSPCPWKWNTFLLPSPFHFTTII